MSVRCQATGQFREGAGKWFRVQPNQYPFTQGCVPANVVGNQWTRRPAVPTPADERRDVSRR